MNLRKKEDSGIWNKKHSQFVEKSFWKELWTSPKTGYRTNE
jgi:hypothetical protein